MSKNKHFSHSKFYNFGENLVNMLDDEPICNAVHTIFRYSGTKHNLRKCSVKYNQFQRSYIKFSKNCHFN